MKMMIWWRMDNNWLLKGEKIEVFKEAPVQDLVLESDSFLGGGSGEAVTGTFFLHLEHRRNKWFDSVEVWKFINAWTKE